MILRLYDFDGTLFKSPSKPEGFKGGWWGKALSLEPPHVPEKPGPEFYNQHVVSDAHNHQSDPNSVSILATGRLGGFRRRLTDLLSHVGLHLPLYCNPGGDTLQFKSKLVTDMLREHACSEIHIWEDRKEHLRALTAFCEGVIVLGKPVVVHGHYIFSQDSFNE